MFDPDGTPRAYDPFADFYNYQPINYLQVPLRRYSGGLMAHADIFDQFEIYTEAFYTRSEVTQNLAPVPARFSVTVNTDNPVLTSKTRTLFENNFLVVPGLASFSAQRRMVESGLRVIESESDYWRAVLGARGRHLQRLGTGHLGDLHPC